MNLNDLNDLTSELWGGEPPFTIVDTRDFLKPENSGIIPGFAKKLKNE